MIIKITCNNSNSYNCSKNHSKKMIGNTGQTILLQYLWNTICGIYVIGTKERSEHKVQN
jgi:hypothetical protein